MQKPFTISPRVIAHLGEDLIKNERPVAEEEAEEEVDIYKDLPREAWFRHVEEKE